MHFSNTETILNEMIDTHQQIHFKQLVSLKKTAVNPDNILSENHNS